MARTPSALPGNIIGAIVGWISGGKGQTESLRAFRDAGGKVRTQTWGQLWRNTAATINNRETIASLPTNRRPTDDMFSPWATTKPDMYAYQVNVMVRDRDAGIVTSRPYTYFSRNRVSPNVAIQDALNTYIDGIEESDDYQSESIEGAVLTGLFKTVPLDRGQPQRGGLYGGSVFG